MPAKPIFERREEYKKTSKEILPRFNAQGKEIQEEKGKIVQPFTLAKVGSKKMEEIESS